MRARLWCMWGSGLLAAASIAHGVRLVTGVQVAINEALIPFWVSQAIFPVAAIASWWLGQRGAGTAERVAPTVRADQHEEAGMEAGYCGMHISRHDLADEDRADE